MTRAAVARRDQAEAGTLRASAALLFSYFTPVGLKPLPREWALDDDLRFGRALYAIGDSLQWAVADWCRAMQDKYGEKCYQVIEDAGLNKHTAMNRMWVGERFPSARRVPALSFSHHDAVAGLEAPEQDRLLARAVEGRLTRSAFRELVKAEREEGRVGYRLLPPAGASCARHVCKACGATWEG